MVGLPLQDSLVKHHVVSLAGSAAVRFASAASNLPVVQAQRTGTMSIGIVQCDMKSAVGGWASMALVAPPIMNSRIRDRP